MTKYGPIIAHQGDPECPCDPDARGRRWYSNGTMCSGGTMGDNATRWERIVCYQLEVEPVRETRTERMWACCGSGGPYLSYHYLHNNDTAVRVTVTVRLEDGKPVAGSWRQWND